MLSDPEEYIMLKFSFHQGFSRESVDGSGFNVYSQIKLYGYQGLKQDIATEKVQKTPSDFCDVCMCNL